MSASGVRSLREYLLQLRWPDGFRCPRCGADEFAGRAVLLRVVTVDSNLGDGGDDFRHPHFSALWFKPMWWSVRNGVSALGCNECWV